MSFRISNLKTDAKISQLILDLNKMEFNQNDKEINLHLNEMVNESVNIPMDSINIDTINIDPDLKIIIDPTGPKGSVKKTILSTDTKCIDVEKIVCSIGQKDSDEKKIIGPTGPKGSDKKTILSTDTKCIVVEKIIPKDSEGSNEKIICTSAQKEQTESKDNGNKTTIGPTEPTNIFEIFSVNNFDMSSFPISLYSNSITQNVVSIPNVSLIYVNKNNSIPKFINNITGGVNGRKIIFTISPNLTKNDIITFSRINSKNGTGLYIPENLNEIILYPGESICFIYIKDSFIPENNNIDLSSGLWFYQYKS